jgi:hypothetical protein
MTRWKEERDRQPVQQTPRGSIDLTEGRSASFEEWNEEASRCNPLDNYARKQKDFNEPDPPGLLLFTQDRTHYLINRSGKDIETVVYETIRADDLQRTDGDAVVYRLTDLPDEAATPAVEAPPEPQAKVIVGLTRVECTDGETWTGGKVLRPECPSSLGPRLENTDLQVINRAPEAVGAREIENRTC